MPLPLLGLLAAGAGIGGLMDLWNESRATAGREQFGRDLGGIFSQAENANFGPQQPGAPMYNQEALAAGLMRDPRTAQMGAGLLGGYYGQQGQMARQSASDMSAMERLKYEMRARQRMAQFAATGQGGGAAPGLEMGKPGTGYMRAIDPQTGMPVDMPIVGGDPWKQAIEGQQSNQRAIDRLTELSELVSKHGSESWNAEVSGRMGTLYGNAVSDIAKARGYGVIQPSELETIQKSFQNPAEGGIFGGATWTRNAKMKSQINSLLAEQIALRDSRYKRNIGPGFEKQELPADFIYGPRR